MFCCILPALMCTAAPTLEPLDLPALTVESTASVEVGIRVTTTQFVARNFTEYPQVFLFNDCQSISTVLFTLPAGCDVRWSFPGQALTGVQIEVVSLRNGAWHDSGTLPLEDVITHGAQALWVQTTDAHSLSWLQVGNDLSLLPAQGDLLPLAVQACNNPDVANTLYEPAHVPVITPSDHPTGDLPPKLEDKPLPPV